MNRIRVVRNLALAAAILASLGCPGEVEVNEGQVTIKGVEAPEGCRVQFQVTLTQPGRTPVKTFLSIGETGIDVGTVTGINLRIPVNIRIEVVNVVGASCDPFVRGAAWEFAGLLTDEAEGKYSVALSQFDKVS